MKLDWNRRYTTVAVYAFFTAVAIICFLVCVLNFGVISTHVARFFNIIKPITYGFAIAYILSPLEKLIHRGINALFKKEKKPHKRLKSAISILIVYIIFIAMLCGFFSLVIPQVGESIVKLTDSINNEYKVLAPVIEEYIRKHDLSGISLPTTSGEIMETINKAFSLLQGTLPKLMTILLQTLTEFKNFIIGILVSIYILANRDIYKKQCKKLLFAMFKKETADGIIGFAADVDNTFGNFISGKILDSVIIGILCFILMTILRLPYAVLISLIVGVTNIIPIFGPFIGAIPSAFIILIDSPAKTIWFVIMIIALQQLDGNVIGPKILGSTTGIPAFWIIFSLIVFGGLYGVFGMLIAIPVFALVYNGIKKWTAKKLKKKNLPEDTNEY